MKPKEKESYIVRAVGKVLTRGISFIVYGDVPAKKNRYRIGNGRMYVPKEVSLYNWDFKVQVLATHGPKLSPLEGQISLEAHFYSKRRKDLDNLLNGLFDAIQASGLVENDSQIRTVHATCASPDKSPRVIFTLRALDN